jgi:hypothetical protein
LPSEVDNSERTPIERAEESCGEGGLNRPSEVAVGVFGQDKELDPGDEYQSGADDTECFHS